MTDEELEVGERSRARTSRQETGSGLPLSRRTITAKSGEVYVLFQGHPVLCIEGFSDEEIQQLVGLLEEEEATNTGSFTSIKVSESAAKDIIRIRRQWHALEPYLGEFDFGVFDPEPPDTFKRYVYINYEAAEFAREIEELREDRRKADEKRQGFL